MDLPRTPSPVHLARVAARGARSQRGAATLVVVMVLFFIIAMVAAYTSRNMIFEQKTSANQYRSTQAFEAAEAGVEWALAMLNGGRIDEQCRPTADLGSSTFRARYIDVVDATSTISLRTRTGGGALMAVCVSDASTNAWTCSCPADAAATLPAVGGTDAKPMFRIRFDFNPLSLRRDSVRIVSAGCTRPDVSCIAESPTAPGGDAMAVVTALVTLRGGLATPPMAPITARGSIVGGLPGAPALRAVTGTDVAVAAGGAIGGAVESAGAAGSPGPPPAQTSLDPALVALGSADWMFASIFNLLPRVLPGAVRYPVYTDQPGVVRLDCAAGCNAATVNAAAQQNPGRPLWLDGDLLVNGDIGSPLPANPALLATELPPGGPVLIIATGNATLASGNVYGVIYSGAATLALGTSGGVTVRGALIAANDLTGSATVIHDAEILTRLRTTHGSFVRVPGGWRDF